MEFVNLSSNSALGSLCLFNANSFWERHLFTSLIQPSYDETYGHLPLFHLQKTIDHIYLTKLIIHI